MDNHYDPPNQPKTRKPLRYIIACTSERAVPSATFKNSILGQPATASNFWEAKDKAVKAKLPGTAGLPLLGVLNNDDAIVAVFGSSPIGPRNPTGRFGGKRGRGFRKSRKGRNTRRNKSRRLRRN